MEAAVPPKDISDSNHPVVSEDIVSSEVAAAHHPEQSHSILPSPKSEANTNGLKEVTEKKNVETEEGVGHVMVEGGEETTEEIRNAEAEIIKSPETKLLADMQPAALDSEVAKMIAEEEMKDTIPPSPNRIRSASPAEGSVVHPSKYKSESRVNTPPLGDEDDVLNLEEEVDGGAGAKKRRGEDSAPPPKRPRRQFQPLPPSLSSLVHPPTTCLYISNLRRPLLLPALHEYVFLELDPESNSGSSLLPEPKAPFASTEYTNVWLSGIKSHAYIVYPSVEEAIKAAERMNNQIFPEDTGGELKVEFVDEDEITRLVQREQDAWAGGRQKLDLKITKGDEGYLFEFQGNGSVGAGARSVRGQPAGLGRGGGGRGGMNGIGRVPNAVPLSGRPTSGINATPVGPRGGGASAQTQSRYPPAPGTGPGTGPREFGPRERAPPPHLDQRGGPGSARGDSYRPGGPAGGRGGFGDRNRGGDGDRRTKVRPELSWREGPRAR
jgi:hypothetical protein